MLKVVHFTCILPELKKNKKLVLKIFLSGKHGKKFSAHIILVPKNSL